MSIGTKLHGKHNVLRVGARLLCQASAVVKLSKFVPYLFQSFPPVSEDLAKAVYGGMIEAYKAGGEAKDKMEEIKKGGGSLTEAIIKHRCAEKPDSSMAPYNSPEGAAFFKEEAMKFESVQGMMKAAQEAAGGS